MNERAAGVDNSPGDVAGDCSQADHATGGGERQGIRLERARIRRKLLRNVKKSDQSVSGTLRVYRLVARAQAGCEQAREQVAVLVRPLQHELVTGQARGWRLDSQATQAAMEQAAEWALEAIDYYDPVAGARDGGASFFTYLARLISFRMYQFALRVHHRPVIETAAVELTDLFCLLPEDGRVRRRSKDDGPDPAQLRLAVTLVHLDAAGLRLWQQLIEGMAVRSIADKLELSDHTARCRRGRLTSLLRRRLD